MRGMGWGWWGGVVVGGAMYVLANLTYHSVGMEGRRNQCMVADLTYHAVRCMHITLPPRHLTYYLVRTHNKHPPS